MNEDSRPLLLPLLGSRLQQAKQTEFFNFFNLQERLVTIKPAGDFRDLVTLHAHLDDRGRIHRMELILARSFIDDKRSAIFAGDIAKSFLRSAVPAADREAIDTLAVDIEHRHARDIGFSVMALQPGAAPSLPEEPSPGYPVYAGRRPLYEQTFSSTSLRLENRRIDGTDALVIELRLDPDAMPDDPAAQAAETQYQGSGRFEPEAALALLQQAHWAAQYDSTDSFISSVRPRLCCLLLRALEEPENEEHPLAVARMRTPIELKMVAKAAHFRLEDAGREPLTEMLTAEEYLDLCRAAAAGGRQRQGK